LLSEAVNRSKDNPMTKEKVQNKVQTIFVLSVHKLTFHCQIKTAEEITQIASMTPLKEIRIYEAK
jgi:hypothetical protein